MTLSTVAGLPAEIRAMLARADVPQDAACESADLPRQTYYRRMGSPADWRLGELERLARAAGCTMRVELIPLARERDEDAREEAAAADEYGQRA